MIHRLSGRYFFLSVFFFFGFVSQNTSMGQTVAAHSTNVKSGVSYAIMHNVLNLNFSDTIQTNTLGPTDKLFLDNLKTYWRSYPIVTSATQAALIANCNKIFALSQNKYSYAYLYACLYKLLHEIQNGNRAKAYLLYVDFKSTIEDNEDNRSDDLMFFHGIYHL